MTTTQILTRFRYIDPTTDLIYVGEAEIDGDETTILSAWQYGTTIEEVFPYTPSFPVTVRRMLEISAREYAMCPPASKIELPTDWDEAKVLDVETNYTIEIKAVLPEVKTDAEAQVYGLSAVKRVRSMNAGKQYQVTAKGGFDDIRRELYRIRLF